MSGQAELFRADRPPPLDVPPSRVLKFLLWGVVVGLALLALGWGASRSRWARVPFGIVVALWGLAIGFIGCFLVYAWMFTDHVVAHRNQNILLCAPWAIALVVPRRRRRDRPARARRARRSRWRRRRWAPR